MSKKEKKEEKLIDTNNRVVIAGVGRVVRGGRGWYRGDMG